MESESQKEIEEMIKEFFPKLKEILEKKKPHLISMYENWYNNATSHPNLAIRYYYASKILGTYIMLKNNQK